VTVGRRTVVTRHADVVEVLLRDSEFTIAEVNAARMERWSGPFILGMDRGPTLNRESDVLSQAARPEDLDRISGFVRDTAAEIIGKARPLGRIDAVGEFTRVVPARLVGSYFGVPGPDEATTMRWMRALFDVVFLDDGARARHAATLALAAQRPYMQALIAERRAAVTAGAPAPDDVLTRLVTLSRDHPWLDDDAIGRNLNGLIVGAVDTTSKAVALVVDELLRRPQLHAAVRAAAVARDIDAVRQYSYEALRFRPHQPIVVRHCGQDSTVGGRRIKAGRLVMAATLSAMFDPAAVAEPRRFRTDRSVAEYLHFGHGLHTCFGRRINFVQIPELVAALLRLPGLRRAAGRQGRLTYDGPFPDQMILEFET
jgi:cytochrome P450